MCGIRSWAVRNKVKASRRARRSRPMNPYVPFLAYHRNQDLFEIVSMYSRIVKIKLGQVDPQYPDPSSSPPYRSSPFADHPSEGRIPRSTDLDTLVHSSASSRHKRVDSEESSHSADSQPGVLLGPLSSADYPHQEFHDNKN
jgi:hypothetical protein